MRIQKTGDGSLTIFSDQFQASYHSIFGALQETEIVFINAGLKPMLSNSDELSILEIGFGTGLNCLMTVLESVGKANIFYTAIEKYPVPASLTTQMADSLQEGIDRQLYHTLHHATWNEVVAITEKFKLLKVHGDLIDFQSDHLYDLIYFDAFAPETQPELWTHEIFNKMASLLHVGGVLTTYCAKGYVKRNLKDAGFQVESLPGPPRKREITRAIKIG